MIETFTPDIFAMDGKTYKVVACVIRNQGAGWQQIDGAHAPINISTVVSDSQKIRVNFNFTAKNVVSFVACPDETMASEGFIMGSSVGLNSADIYVSQHRTIGGYVYYDSATSTFKWLDGLGSTITAATFNAGILTITHANITGLLAQTTCRDGVYVASCGTLGTNTTSIAIRDYAGNLVTTPDPYMRFYFSRTSRGLFDPNTYNNTGGNIWCYGIFEI